MDTHSVVQLIFMARGQCAWNSFKKTAALVFLAVNTQSPSATVWLTDEFSIVFGQEWSSYGTAELKYVILWVHRQYVVVRCIHYGKGFLMGFVHSKKNVKYHLPHSLNTH